MWKRDGALLVNSKRRDSVRDVLPGGRLHQCDGTHAAAHGVSSSCSEEPITDCVDGRLQECAGTDVAALVAAEDCDATTLDGEPVIDLTADTSFNGGLSQVQLHSEAQGGGELLRAAALIPLIATAQTTTLGPETEASHAGGSHGNSTGRNSQKMDIDG